MAGIENSLTSGTNIITNIIVWFSTLMTNIINGIGAVEIFFFLLIGAGFYFYLRQHSLEPRKVYKF
jgi:hypothetical protein